MERAVILAATRTPIGAFQGALASLASAQNSEQFAQETTPVQITDARGKVTAVEHDEGPGKVNYEKIPTLGPAFDKNGTITAANASTLTDLCVFDVKPGAGLVLTERHPGVSLDDVRAKTGCAFTAALN